MQELARNYFGFRERRDAENDIGLSSRKAEQPAVGRRWPLPLTWFRSGPAGARLEAQGHKILKLNIGNTAPFGFDAPDAILADMIHNLPQSQGYSDSRGIYSARTAVAQYYQSRGLKDVDVDDVYIGNGVSELISMVLTTFVDDGNEVLIPAPDYPLWTGAVTLTGGTPVHYRCDEANGWIPDLADIEAKITDATFAIVIINPNNPTGAVYSADVVRGPGRHRPQARPGRDGRRDLREDHFRRPRAPPRRHVRRR